MHRDEQLQNCVEFRRKTYVYRSMIITDRMSLTHYCFMAELLSLTGDTGSVPVQRSCLITCK